MKDDEALTALGDLAPFRLCPFCGCNTNARNVRCCTRGSRLHVDDFDALAASIAADRKLIDELRARVCDRDTRQDLVYEWVRNTFGTRCSLRDERVRRFLEEAVELAQAAGIEREMVDRIVTRVFDRPSGDLRQEIGGVGITLLALCESLKCSADKEEQKELKRVLEVNPEYFRGRHTMKAREGTAEPCTRPCSTCGKQDCAPMNHAGWHPDDDKAG